MEIKVGEIYWKWPRNIYGKRTLVIAKYIIDAPPKKVIVYDENNTAFMANPHDLREIKDTD